MFWTFEIESDKRLTNAKKLTDLIELYLNEEVIQLFFDLISLTVKQLRQMAMVQRSAAICQIAQFHKTIITEEASLKQL